MAELADRSLPLAAVFGPDGTTLELEVEAQTGAGAIETFLRARLTTPDPTAQLVEHIIAWMLRCPVGSRVTDVAAHHEMSTRALQRLFRRYVGAGPKWVLQRYRLHSAAERIAAGDRGGWAEIVAGASGTPTRRTSCATSACWWASRRVRTRPLAPPPPSARKEPFCSSGSLEAASRRRRPACEGSPIVTPTQLRAFAAVVRLGSVKRAAAELAVSDAAVSLHVGQLRKEFGDKLFTRTAAGLAFTPGGLRLASRAAEILELQDRTILEVSQAGSGRRLLRVAASSLFAEHAAPGLIELFAGRAADLDVELSVHDPRTFKALLTTRAVDVAIGPRPPDLDESILYKPILNFQVAMVTAPDHPLTAIQPSMSQLREQTWLLGPSAAARVGLISVILRRINVPEERQQIFQSHVAALEAAKRGKGVALAVSFAVSQDIANGDLKRINGQSVTTKGDWGILSLTGGGTSPVSAEFIGFVTTPRATHAMVGGAGVTAGRFRPSSHVTMWN